MTRSRAHLAVRRPYVLPRVDIGCLEHRLTFVPLFFLRLVFFFSVAFWPKGGTSEREASSTRFKQHQPGTVCCFNHCQHIPVPSAAKGVNNKRYPNTARSR